MEMNYPALHMTAEQFIGLLKESTKGFGWEVVTYPVAEWKARHPDAQPETRIDFVSTIVLEERGELTIGHDETFRFEIVPTGQARIAVRARLSNSDARDYFFSRLTYIGEKCPEARGNWWIGPKRPIKQALVTWVEDIGFEVMAAAVERHLTDYVDAHLRGHVVELVKPGQMIFTVALDLDGLIGEMRVVRLGRAEVSELKAHAWLLPPLMPNRDEVNKRREDAMMRAFEHVRYQIVQECDDAKRMKDLSAAQVSNGAQGGTGVGPISIIAQPGSQVDIQMGGVRMDIEGDARVSGDVVGKDKITNTTNNTEVKE